MTPRSSRLGWTGRLLALLIAATGFLGLAASARLRPDPRGFGTHTQLGLPPCSYLSRTGRQCPTCGMTTAAAWTARGRPDLAWSANPAAAILAPLWWLASTWLAACGLSGRPLGWRSIDRPLVVLVVASVALGLAAWSIRRLLGRV